MEKQGIIDKWEKEIDKYRHLSSLTVGGKNSYYVGKIEAISGMLTDIEKLNEAVDSEIIDCITCMYKTHDTCESPCNWCSKKSEWKRTL